MIIQIMNWLNNQNELVDSCCMTFNNVTSVRKEMQI